MDRTWKIEFRITLGSEARDYIIGADNFPTTAFLAERSASDEGTSQYIFACMRTAARQAVHNLGDSHWWKGVGRAWVDVGPVELRDWINRHVRSGASEDKET